jgi:hypothetical protein
MFVETAYSQEETGEGTDGRNHLAGGGMVGLAYPWKWSGARLILCFDIRQLTIGGGQGARVFIGRELGFSSGSKYSGILCG